MENTFKAGDLVAFDIEGSSKSPFGYGRVTKISPHGGPMIQPQYPIQPGLRMMNIRKVEKNG